jgi:hypothetical protein
MVILGGLELVAAGYILHKHSKNKRERQRLREAEELLEEEEYHRRSHSHTGRGRRHSHERERSHTRRHRHDHKEYYGDQKPAIDAQTPSQYLKPEYLPAHTQPQRASSAPPPQEGYPPTGWPAHWKQSQYPEPNNRPIYGWKDGTQHQQYSTPVQDRARNGGYSQDQINASRGRADARSSQEMSGGRGDDGRRTRVTRSGDELSREDYYDPPPEYRR